MSDPWTQVAGGLLTLFGVALTVWGSIRVGRNADKAKAEADRDSHELGLIDRYQAALDETEKRLNRRINELETGIQRLRDDLRAEQSTRREAEAQRDAAVMHAQELRDAWPGSSTVPPPPQIIAGLFRLGSHHQPTGSPWASS